ncbi:MAG: monooxygenase [Hyphomicrobiaceae bacterium]
MITAIVRFKLPATVKAEDAVELFKGSAPKYRGLAGLVRKYYLYNETGIGGGVYLWESRAAADRVYTAEWKKMIADRYGAEPEITYYETPVVVDNTIDEIQVAAAE